MAGLTRSSAIADKRARRVYGSVRVTKHSTIHMLDTVSYCAIQSINQYSYICIFVFKTRRFYDIRLQKCRDLEIRIEVTQCHWKWYHSIDLVRFPI